jgi:hypothetical protein
MKKIKAFLIYFFLAAITSCLLGATVMRIPTSKTTVIFTNFTSQYPPAHNDTYVKATDTYATYYAYDATNPAKSLTGATSGNEWCCNGGPNRFHIDLGSAKQIDRIYYENGHNAGNVSASGWYDVKDFTFWGSNSATAFAELTYDTDTNWTQITCAQTSLDIHVSLDQADPKYILITSGAGAYRYYAFKFANQYNNDTVAMRLRRVELQTGN